MHRERGADDRLYVARLVFLSGASLTAFASSFVQKGPIVADRSSSHPPFLDSFPVADLLPPHLAWSSPEPLIASLLTSLHLALPLYQIRTGPNIGRRLLCGGIVEGTDEAIRAEIRTVLSRIMGNEGQEMRRAAREWGEKLKRSVREKGGSGWEAMRRLGEVGVGM